MREVKLKKYLLHWSATINGVDEVEAIDEQDAEEQFDSILHEDRMPNEPVHAELDWVEPKGKK